MAGTNPVSLKNNKFDVLKTDNSMFLALPGKYSVEMSIMYKNKLEKLGFELTEEALNASFERFKILADKKKEIYDDDLRALVTNEMTKAIQIFELISLQVMDSSNGIPSAAITIKHEDKEITDAGIGNGSMDAIFKTIDRISGYEGKLMDYKVKSVSKGKDALANVTVKVSFEENEPSIIGHGLNIDTMLASARAYVGALNSYLSMRGKLKHRHTDSSRTV